MERICSSLMLSAIWMLQPVLGLCQGTNIQKPIEYTLKSDVYLFNGKSPFWINTNQYGTIPSAKNLAFSGQATLKADYQRDSLRKFKHLLGWGASISPVFNAGDTTQFVLPEGFIKLRVGSFEMWGGKRRETYGLLGDTLLSSGSYSWSGNALPMPKVQINTIGFVEIPFTQSLLSFNASFSHGWFGTMPVLFGSQGLKSVEGYLHQKSFYLRLGKPHWRIHFTGGFNHQAQWGGENQIWPHGLPPKEAWWAVVIGKSWERSRVGNHLGTLDVGVSWKWPTGEISFYRQNIYDDGSLYTFLNIKDGLNGVVFHNKWPRDASLKMYLRKISVEYFNSTNQGGAVFDFVAGIFGKDNYMNHYVYQQGWSYRGRGIGTPFITAQKDIRSSFPQNNQFTNNNRVKALYIAAMGSFSDWDWLVRTSFSRNFGTYEFGSTGGTPFSKVAQQFSGLIRLQKPLPWLKGLFWTTTLAVDAGKLLQPATGIQMGLCKRGSF
jgi:hypothetical protein